MQLEPIPLFTSAQIRQRVAGLGAAISKDFAGRDLIVVAVLKSSVIFVADLLRTLSIPVELEFIRARSYRRTRSQGTVEFLCLPEQLLSGKYVLVVEDIIDTGRTLSAVLDTLAAEGPAQLAVCALLDKPARREAAVQADYVGFTIEDHFVVGYGLDYEQHARELPDIRVLVDQ